MDPSACKKIVNVLDCPRVVTDKNGEELVVRCAGREDFSVLLEMYDLFEPKQCAQGIPPADPVKRRDLVRSVLDYPVNVICLAGGRTVGHACLIDIIPWVRAELEIAVHQDWRDRGLGMAMLEMVIDAARQHDYDEIWLTVAVSNRRAIHIYRKNGFEFNGPLDTEREMELRLKN